MRKAIPVVGVLLFILIFASACSKSYYRPGRGNFKGYKYRKQYKSYKPTYTNPRRVIHYKQH